MKFVQHWHVCCGVAPCSPASQSTKMSISRFVNPDWHVCSERHSNQVLSVCHHTFVLVVTVSGIAVYAPRKHFDLSSTNFHVLLAALFCTFQLSHSLIACQVLLTCKNLSALAYRYFNQVQTVLPAFLATS